MEQATLFLIIFQPIRVVELCVQRSRSVAVRSMHNALLAREVAAAHEVVDELGARARAAQVLEAHFVNINGHDLLLVVAVYVDAVVRHVAEVGGTVDVVHLYAAQFAGGLVAVHLARVGYEDDEAAVALGKAAELVQDGADKVAFRHAALLFQAVHRVYHDRAHTTAAHQLAGFEEDVVYAVGAVAGHDVRHVVRQPLPGLPVDIVRHAVAGGKLAPQQLVGYLLEVILHGLVFGAVVGCLPAVAQAQASNSPSVMTASRVPSMPLML